MPSIYRYTEPSIQGGGLATAKSVARIRRAVRSGAISTTTRILKEGERLDQIASQKYGDSRLWWIIAAASNIGWWLQVQPGTVLTIPTNLVEVDNVI